MFSASAPGRFLGREANWTPLRQNGGPWRWDWGRRPLPARVGIAESAGGTGARRADRRSLTCSRAGRVASVLTSNGKPDGEPVPPPVAFALLHSVLLLMKIVLRTFSRFLRDARRSSTALRLTVSPLCPCLKLSLQPSLREFGMLIFKFTKWH